MNIMQIASYMRNIILNGNYGNNINCFNARRHAITSPVTNMYNCNIAIAYPGKNMNPNAMDKNGNTYQRLDFSVKYNNGNRFFDVPFTLIMDEFYNIITGNLDNVMLAVAFIYDIYNYGENINLNNYSSLKPYLVNFDLASFLEVICFICASEELNYPSSGGFIGCRMCLNYYLQTIYVTYYNTLNYTVIQNRIKGSFVRLAPSELATDINTGMLINCPEL